MKKCIIVCDHIHDEGLKILQSQDDIIMKNFIFICHYGI